MIHISKCDCSGCHSCASICPQDCIVMKTDEEGFLYPSIDEKTCINCGLCEKACQAIEPIFSNSQSKAYACINKNEQIRLESSSGGVFSLLAEFVIKKAGAVFGAAFNDEFNVEHLCIENIEELYRFRGSKYVQSTIGDAYKSAKSILDSDRYVLFTGTPCQIDGLLHYLKKPYDKLYTQDIICHGVPSSLVWQKYIQYREAKALSKTQKLVFRNKNNGWATYSVYFNFINNTRYEQFYKKDLFMRGFLANLYLRPSCSNCHSKTIHRNSDITLADFWGVEKVLPEMFDDKGTSLVLVNSEKGKELLNSVSESLLTKAVDIDEALKFNPSVRNSVRPHKNRKKFFRDFSVMDFDKLIEKYTKDSLVDRCILKLKVVVKRFLKKTGIC